MIEIDYYYKQLERSAKNRNISFCITQDDIKNKYKEQNGLCKLSGIEIKFSESPKTLGFASVDRIDSLKGYTKDNIQIVHLEVNRMKMDMSNQKFLFWCEKIAANNNNNNRGESHEILDGQQSRKLSS